MKISKEHYDSFMRILAKLNEKTPLLLDNVENVIHEKLQMCFPEDGMSAGIKVLSDNDTNRLMPYAAIVSVTARVNHLSKVEPLLEFKIYDPPIPKLRFNTWLSVFPDGRVVFQTNGLTLDSLGKISKIDQRALRLECHMYRPSTIIDNLSCQLMNMVPIGESIENKRVRDKAYSVFRERSAVTN